MSSATSANSVNLLKRLWGNDLPTPQYKASKLLASCKKDSTFGSEGRYVVVSIAPTGGGSADFGEAVQNQRQTTEVRFFVGRKREYQVWSIDNEAIHATRGDKNAIVELVKHSLNRARYAYARARAKRVHGNGGGTLARISAAQSLASSTVTVRNRADISGFESGMTIQFASADGTGTGASSADLRDGGKRAVVGNVTRYGTTATFVLLDPATLTPVALNTWAAITVNDYIVRAGDYANAMTGMKGWTPSTTPTAGVLFFGADRNPASGTGDVQRTSGIIHNGNGGDRVQTVIDAFAMAQNCGMGSEGSDDYTLFVDPFIFADFQKNRESVRQLDATITESKISVKALEVATAMGSIKIMSEQDQEQGVGRVLATSEIYARSAGDDPMDLVGGNGLLTYQNEDKRQGRIGCYGNFFHENPGNSLIIVF